MVRLGLGDFWKNKVGGLGPRSVHAEKNDEGRRCVDTSLERPEKLEGKEHKMRDSKAVTRQMHTSMLSKNYWSRKREFQAKRGSGRSSGLGEFWKEELAK